VDDVGRSLSRDCQQEAKIKFHPVRAIAQTHMTNLERLLKIGMLY